MLSAWACPLSKPKPKKNKGKSFVGFDSIINI
jgi:hypothetical protein